MRNALRALRAGALILVAAACSDNGALAPTLRQPETTLGTARVSPLNLIMAVGQTQQLSVTALSLTGAPIASLDSVQYMLQNITDTLRVKVSPAGVVTAIAPTFINNPVLMQVISFKDGLAKGDVAIIQVTQDVIPGAVLSIQPVPPDSTRIAQNTYKQIIPYVGNPATGDSVSNPTIALEVKTADIGKIGVYGTSVSTPTLTANELFQSDCVQCIGYNAILIWGNSGNTWVYANASVYGTMLRDSVQYTLTNQATGYAGAGLFGFQLDSYEGATIAPGGIINFGNGVSNAYAVSVDITFDNPAAATSANGGPSGNIIALPYGQSEDRQFLTPGVYTWTLTMNGAIPLVAGQTAHGKVVVE